MPIPNSTRYSFKLTCAFLLTCIAAGIGGMLLSLLLHFVQHVAFGYGFDTLTAHESFLQGVRSSPPWRRVFALALCGLIAGLGWYGVFRFGKPLVSVSKAVKTPPHLLPFATTLVHALLQVITVGLGSPLGREVAPREVGSIFACTFARWLDIKEEDTALVVACGAGAGLAAVYNVPLAGALFILEVLMVSWKPKYLIPAFFCSASAAIIAWGALGNAHQYFVVPIGVSASYIAWAICIGPLLGAAAYFFAWAVNTAQAKAPTHKGNWHIIPLSVVNFTLIGIFSIQFPGLIGNGKGPVQLLLDDSFTPLLAGSLLVLRFIFTVSTVRIGASGGVLTPGVLHGALIAVLAGSVWNIVFPAVPISHFAIVGGTAFLASSMRMPITAVVLVYELTVTDHNTLYPMLLATAGSYLVSTWLKTRAEAQKKALA